MSDQWKTGHEFAPYHRDSSIVEPGYRDGWNACYELASKEIERLRDLLRVEQALALRQDPFRCYDIECEWFGRHVRAGDCQCHHLQATTHRANVRDALAKKEQR